MTAKPILKLLCYKVWAENVYRRAQFSSSKVIIWLLLRQKI